MPTKKLEDDITQLVSLQSLIYLQIGCAYIIIDILCAQISAKDVTYIYCRKLIKTASNFTKNYTNCIIRMAGQLSETTRAEAFQQKTRIKEAVKQFLRKNTKRPRDR